MKLQKVSFLTIILLLLLSTLQVGLTLAQEKSQYHNFLPLLLNPKTAAPTISPMPFGVALFRGQHATLARQANAHWAHYNGLLWSEIQKEGPTSNWESDHAARVDQDLLAMREAGMDVVLTIRSTPAWARDHDYFCGPMREGNINQFADFVSEVVQRYSQPPYNVTFYEIWNEPDDIPVPGGENNPYGCWGDPGKKGDPGSDPLGGGGFYAQVLKAVYPQVKQANPDALVVLGGLLLWGDPNIYLLNRVNFFEGILAEGGGNYFDVANFHAYTTYDPAKTAIQSERDELMWSNSGGQVEGKLGYLRDMMDKFNVPQKPVMLTEVALYTWDTQLPDYDPDFEAAKADYVVWLYTRNQSEGILGTSWYHLESYGWNKSGLLDRDNTPLPAYEAYKVMAHTLEDFTYLKDLTLSDGILGFEFISGNQRIWVLFSEDGSQQAISVPTGFNQAYDLFENPVFPAEGQINFTRPIYVELTK